MIAYNFRYDDGTDLRFEVDEEGDSSSESVDLPDADWLALENGRCEGCPLPPGSRKTCPAALSIHPILSSFGNRLSHETVKVVVEMNELEVHGTMSLQDAVRSLMGLQLGLCSCPVLKKLRPMARFHVPFGTQEQSLFRFVGTHLIAQYFRREGGLPFELDLTGLLDGIKELHKVNERLVERICQGVKKDAAINSLVILDTVATLLEIDLDANLDELRSHFGVYLEGV